MTLHYPNILFYPPEFKQRVKALYPNWSKEYFDLLEEGSISIGSLLNTTVDGVDPDTILEATSLEAIQEEAKVIKARLALYHEWGKLLDAQK